MPESTLREHPEFGEFVQRSDRTQGINRGFDCDEGLDVMDELAASGAQVRDLGGPARDTFVLLGNQSFLLTLWTLED